MAKFCGQKKDISFPCRKTITGLIICYPEDRGLLKVPHFAFICFVAICTIGSGFVRSEEIKAPYTGVVIASAVNVRYKPDLASSPMGKIARNTLVLIIDDNTSWYKIRLKENLEGWIWRRYVSTDLNQINSRGLVRLNLVDYAQNFLNTPYVYGGSSPQGFDCSGFTCYIFSKFGYLLPHRALEQVQIGEPIPQDELQPGDLLFFITQRSEQINHVGIYLGNGNFIHASSGTGSVRINALNEGYYRQRFQCARRILTSFTPN
jgi:hypothetical protein